MDWKNLPGGADRVQDNRGRGGGPMIGGIGGIILLLAAAYFGVDPAVLSGVVGQTTTTQSGEAPADDGYNEFLGKVTTSTDQVWSEIFAQSGLRYNKPIFVRFAGQQSTACGMGTSGSGPFYCSGDNSVYLDTSFFNEMKRSLGGGGEFAYAYVVAHEVGHHVQNELGVLQKAHQQGAEMGGNAQTVRLELQADCYAGVWAHHVADLVNLSDSDIRQAINTAQAIGDDHLQARGGGTVQPETFTHGTSEQRVNWLKKGLQSGNPSSCDSFSGPYEAL